MQVLNFQSQYQPGETPYQIFQNRMAAITSIVTGIKNIISNKYINKQNSMIAENIQNEIDKQKAIDLSSLIMSPAPEEIYPANLEDTIGQFYDKFAAMGSMRKKETMMGNLPSLQTGMGPMTQKEMMTGGLPAVGGFPAVGGVTPTTTPTTTEAIIPKTDLYQLYNVIKDLPTGEITWDNIYKKMTEKKPYFMGTTEPEQFVLNQMLGQVTDQKSKLASDINLAKLVKEAFYPEEVYEKPSSELEYWLQEHPGQGVEQYWEAKKEPITTLDVDALNVFMKDNNLKVKGITVNEKGERNISLEPIEVSGEEPSLSDMLTLIKGLEAQGFNASYTKNGLSVGIPEPKTMAGEKNFTTTEMNYVDTQFEGIKTNEQYDVALNKISAVDPKLAKQAPSKEKKFKDNYDETMSYIKSLIDDNGKILEGNPGNSKYSYEQIYAQAYDDLVEAIQEYKIATGVTFYNPYISLDEYNKSDKTKWYNPTTWTSQPSVNQ